MTMEDTILAENTELRRRLDTMTEVARGNKRHVAELTRYTEQAEAEIARLRAFVEWCARLDHPDPETGKENARQLVTVEKIAYAARHTLNTSKEH